MHHLTPTQPPKILHLGEGRHQGTGSPERYHFEDLWSLHLYSMAFDLDVGDQHYQVKPGNMTLIGPRQHMAFHFQKRVYRHFFCIFHLDVETSDFTSSLCHLNPEQLQCCTYLFRSAVQQKHLDPSRSQAAIWEILWQLHAFDGPAKDGQLNPVLLAQHVIAANLNHDLCVAQIAKDLKISANQLTRLFNKELGMTVIAYIRQERMKLAKRLIQESELPIKRVANECGFSDLQYFNKTVRQFYQCSPRQLRV